MGTVRRKSKHGNITKLSISFSDEKRAAQTRLKPTTTTYVNTAYEVDALQIELLRQLGWLGRIKAIQCKDNQSLNLINRQIQGLINRQIQGAEEGEKK